jgi:hypothetical protein
MAEDEAARLERIRGRMQSLRTDMHRDVREVVLSTREMTDWKTYVRRYPWVCVGLAAGVGFLLVPKKVYKEYVQPSDKQVMKLAKEDRLHINTEPVGRAKSSIVTTALMFVMSAVLRSAMAYAGQQLGKTLQGITSDDAGNPRNPFADIRSRGGL